MTTKTFEVFGVLTAGTKSYTVEAANIEEAMDKAYDLDINPSICHHCSNEVTLDDNVSFTVIGEDGEELQEGDVFTYTQNLEAKLKMYKDKFGEL